MDSSENPIGRGNCREIEAVREREGERERRCESCRNWLGMETA
jgi:hypothetical protein